jgi:hypothetical protein
LKSKDKILITFSLLGVAAYIFTDIIHEVIGHSGTCLLIGQHITLLTSVYFRSFPGSVITDLGGPLSNLLFVFLIALILKYGKNLSLLTAFLLFLTMSYNCFWFSGTVLQSSFSKTGDWTYAVEKLNIGTLGKPILIFAGITAYYFSIKLVRIFITSISTRFPNFPLRPFIYYSYFAAAVAAIIAGLFFAPDRIHSAFEGLLEMIASLPILFIARDNSKKSDTFYNKSNPALDFAICILFIVFCLTLGHGFVF